MVYVQPIYRLDVRVILSVRSKYKNAEFRSDIMANELGGKGRKLITSLGGPKSWELKSLFELQFEIAKKATICKFTTSVGFG